MFRSIRHFAKLARGRVIHRIPKLGARFAATAQAQWWRDRSWMMRYQVHLDSDGRAGTRCLDRRFTLIQLAQSVADLRGSTVECGTASGTGSALICECLAATYAVDEFHFAFDSFEGVSEPTALDYMASGKCRWYKGKLANHYETVARRLGQFPFCRVQRGWIPDKFDCASSCRVRLVHIDVDLYEPTRDSVAFFYPRMVPGGVMICDDYGFADCPGARQALDEYFAERPESVIELTTGQAMVIKTAEAAAAAKRPAA